MLDYDPVFRYVQSSELQQCPLKVKIGCLDWKPDEGGQAAGVTVSPQEVLDDPALHFHGADPYITIELFGSDGRRLCVPTDSRRAPLRKEQLFAWNEWVSLPLNISDLPRRTVLCFTLWDVYGSKGLRPIGGTSLSVFSHYGQLRQGMYELRVWSNKVAHYLDTPGKLLAGEYCELARLLKLKKQYAAHLINEILWQDKTSLRDLEVKIMEEKRKLGYLFLNIEFQRFIWNDKDYNVIYFEPDANEIIPSRPMNELVLCPDPDIDADNLVEDKHHIVERDVSRESQDRDRKPNAKERNILHSIMTSPPDRDMTKEEKDLVWKYRYYLRAYKKGLAKFLRCVDFTRAPEVRHTETILQEWEPIDPADALELLSPLFKHECVRLYAVGRLHAMHRSDTETILLYLPQLVQALRYVPDFDNLPTSSEPAATSTEGSTELTASDSPETKKQLWQQELSEVDMETQRKEDTLANFLIQQCLKKSSKSRKLGHYFYWHLTVEGEEATDKDKVFSEVLGTFLKRLKIGNLDQRAVLQDIMKQRNVVSKLNDIMKRVMAETGQRPKKEESLKRLLMEEFSGESSSLPGRSTGKPKTSVFPFPLHLDPSVTVTGIDYQSIRLFKSSKMPAKIKFLCEDGGSYTTIFKHGDDLRQDQLVLQMIEIMDVILKKENLDLRLTPYKVLATGKDHGFVELIDAVNLSNLNIQSFLRKHNHSPNCPYGISSVAMENYIRSCAAYCIVTYLLGVGDRHLDNLLICNDGKIFHIDFGFILGNDPKPMPSPMKLTLDMVNAMGGQNSQEFYAFLKHCNSAYNALRRHASLFINLFSLMLDSNIQDIKEEPDKAVKKVLDRFCLHLSDDKASEHLWKVMRDSISAFMPQFMDTLHDWTQAMKR